MADGRFDDLLLGLASRHNNVEELSHSILSFFERRTDLFHVMETADAKMGFRPAMAEEMAFKHFHFFQQRYAARCQPHLLRAQAEAATDGDGSAGSDAQPPAADAAPEVIGAAEELVKRKEELQAEGLSAKQIDENEEVKALEAKLDVLRAAQALAAASAAPAAAAATAAAAESSGSAVVAKEGDSASAVAAAALPETTRKMMRHISTWNGAVTNKYYWSQSIAEVTCEVEVEEGAKAKDIRVDITPTRLSVKCKGKTVLEGKLHEKVNVEDCIWHLDENGVVVSLEKQRETWWKCVLEGDEEIDTTKVESTRTMDEYDGETQGAIRKIMFDQHQKVQGKATSDQIRTAEMMKDAWNAEGSPFRGSEFDPTLLNLSGSVPDDFFEDLEKKKLEEARSQKGPDQFAKVGPGGPPSA